MVKKVIVFILSLFIVSTIGCTTSNKIQGNPADMSGYGVESTRFIETTFSNFSEIKDNETFAIYFGYPECDSCLEATPILNGILEQKDDYIYYINVKNHDLYDKETDSAILKEEVLKFYPASETFGVPLIMFYRSGSLKQVIQGMRNPSEEMEKAILEGLELIR